MVYYVCSHKPDHTVTYLSNGAFFNSREEVLKGLERAHRVLPHPQDSDEAWRIEELALTLEAA
jgi:hypothetical protein